MAGIDIDSITGIAGNACCIIYVRYRFTIVGAHWFLSMKKSARLYIWLISNAKFNIFSDK
jgi:hypothetical protein